MVGLLSVLVYVGIRIIISSTSSDKAKYKQLLVDWLVAICLLFFMQYIMSGSNLIVKKITELLSSAGYPNYVVELDDEQTEKAVEEINGASDGARAALAELGVLGQDQDAESLVKESGGKKYLTWNTNLFGILRVEAQLSKSGKMTYAGYTIMYVMICLFTIYFIFTYLKRVLYMAFLTIIAPLVALTYPIDKMNDGKAQAFDMWFKEYIFNLLIQPLHLLLYTVLVSSALELASENVLYSIVAIAFLIPAEKLMRKFFGFEKAQTPGLLAGPAGAALTMTGLNKLMGHRPPKHGGNEKLGGKASEESENKKIAFNSKFNKQDGIINAAMNSKEKNKNEQDEDTWNSFFKNTNSRNDKDNKALSTDLTQLNSANPVFNNNKNKGRKLRAIGGYSRAVRKYGSAMKGKMKNYASNVYPIRTATKIATGAAGAAIFGTAAGIAGLTSGDANKAVQYASTGVLGGYKLGDSLAGGVQSTLSVPVDLKDEFEQGYYDTEEYEQHIKERQQDEMKKSSEVKWALEDNFGKEEADYIRKNVMDDYTDAGVTDINDIIAGYKAEKDGELSREKAISGIKYSNRIGKDTDAMDDLSKWQKRFSEEFAKNERVREANLDAEKLGKQTITVTYGGKTTSYEVNVKDYVTGISIAPNAITGKYNSKLQDLINNNNIMYTITYAKAGAKPPVALAESMVSGYNKTSVTDQTLTVTYVDSDATSGTKTQTFKANLKVSLSNPTQSIAIKTQPTKTEYGYGDTIDLSNGKITITKANGDTEEKALTDSSVKVTETDGSTVDLTKVTFGKDNTATKTIKVTYDGKDTTYQIKVTNKITGIKMHTTPKAQYNVNDAIDLTTNGSNPGEILVTRQTGTPSVVSIKDVNVKVTGFDSSKENAKLPLTVSYTENGETKTTTYNVSVKDTVTAISMKKTPKTEYKYKFNTVNNL